PRKPSLREALVRTDGHRRRGHARELQHANLRDVRAGGACGRPRLPQSEPALAGPPPRGPGDRSPAKAPRLLTNVVAPPRTKAGTPQWSAAGFLADTNEAALMKIFRGRP